MARVYDSSQKKSIPQLLFFVTPNSRVLEFGSATGYWTRFMKEEQNCEVTCVELIPEAAEKARVYAEKMIVADIDNGAWEKEIDGDFDYIIFGDVLEHLKKPKNAIEKAKKFLKPTGFRLTSVPNISHNAILLSLRKGRFEYTEMGLLDNTHIYFFTRKSLFTMFNSVDLWCVEEKCIFGHPCTTGLGVHYLTNPLLTLSILRKKDGHVYQFVNKWKIGGPQNKYPGIRLSLFRSIAELLIDFAHFIISKMSQEKQADIKKRYHSYLAKRKQRTKNQ